MADNSVDQAVHQTDSQRVNKEARGQLGGGGGGEGGGGEGRRRRR